MSHGPLMVVKSNGFTTVVKKISRALRSSLVQKEKGSLKEGEGMSRAFKLEWWRHGCWEEISAFATIVLIWLFVSWLALWRLLWLLLC